MKKGVKQDFKKTYRAKHAKLAKALLIPPVFIKFHLGVLCALCASHLFSDSVSQCFSNMFG
jgi:hypothetical protein